MSNVISFPQKSETTQHKQTSYGTGAKTLFLHIKRTTMIVHLAAQPQAAVAGGRVGKS